MYALQFDERVEKEFKKIPPEIRAQLLEKIHGLAHVPRPHGCVKLSTQGGYRIRQGDYRVLYEVDDTDRVVRIFRAGHRSAIYRR